MYKEKDDLQIYLESVCHVQAWAKKMISKAKQKVDVINTESISSLKRRLK